MICSSCKEKKRILHTERPVSETETVQASVSPAFDAFYERFHTDSLYQMDHIVFPLPEQQGGDPWLKEHWSIHANPLSDNENVQREIKNLNGLIIEVVYHKLGFFLIERRFMPQGPEDWDMIYYAERTNLGDWQKQYEGSTIDVSPVKESSTQSENQ